MRAAPRAFLALTLLACGAEARADEGGVPFWLSGQYASLAAVPQSPGFSVPVMVYYYQGSTDPTKTLQRTGMLTTGLEVRMPIVYLSPTWVPHFRLLGGRPAFTLTFGAGHDQETAAVADAAGTVLSRSDSTGGLTDLYPLVELAWASGINNGMAYATGDLPVGDYDSTRLSNVGIGHFAADLGGAYTLFHKDAGFELSGVAGFTFNAANTHTQYKNGVDFHLDYAASRFFTKSVHAGVVGYLYYQLTDDSGSGDRVGASRSKVSSLGGEAGSFFTVAGKQWYANVRGYWEYWAQNRPQGFALFGVVDIPLPITR